MISKWTIQDTLILNCVWVLDARSVLVINVGQNDLIFKSIIALIVGTTVDCAEAQDVYVQVPLAGPK